MEIDETSNYLNVGIAINGNKSSKYVVRWALDKFAPEGNAIMKLIHVRLRILGVPSKPKTLSISCTRKQYIIVGNLIPVSQVREDTSAAYTKEIECKTNEMLLPYRRMCAKAQVKKKKKNHE